MTANEIVGRQDFQRLVKHAISLGLAKRQTEIDDFAQDVALHILKYPPKKEYAATTIISMACKWVQQERAKKSKQDKFESNVSLIDPTTMEHCCGTALHANFKQIDDADEIDEIIENSELTSHQLVVIKGMLEGKNQKMITEEGTTSRQNIALHVKNALRKMRESCTPQS